MRPIDEKIIKMKLDYRDFQTGASRLTGILGGLNSKFSRFKGADFKESTRGLANLNNEAQRTTLDRMADGVQTITGKFSTLSVVAITALTNITNKAVDAGIKLAKALTIDPIKDGLAEYETKLNAVQTIMSNTQGKNSMGEITDTLDDLNTYADKTIYNFAEMTRNVGTFTAAGVGLEDSKDAIKGIANLAAASGSNSQQASTAMYQLSQALATGNVKLQDWNSVVNAGMGGKLFQDALTKTADKMGVARDKTLTFRDSLQEGWLTTEVLMATLQEFAVDESMLDAATKVKTFTQLVETTNEAIGSGWASTWELLIGDFETAREIWSDAAEAIGKPIEASAEARNAIVKNFVEMGGRASIIGIISNTFNGLLGVMKMVGDAFKSVFPPITAEVIFKIVKSIEEFSKKLILSEANAAKVTTIFKGLFSIFSIGISAAKLLGQGIMAIIPKGLGSGLVNFIVKIAEMIVKFDEAIKGSTKMEGVFSSVGNAVDGFASGIGKFADFIVLVFKGASNTVSALLDFITPFVKVIGDAVDKITSKLSYNDILNGGLVAALIIAVKKFGGIGEVIEGVFDSLSNALSGIGDSFGILDDLRDTLSAFTGSIKADNLLKIAGALAILVAALAVLSTIPGEEMSKSLMSLGVLMALVSITMSSISKSNVNITNSVAASTTVLALGTALLLLAAGLKVISTIDADDMGRSLLALGVIVATLTVSVIAISKLGGRIKTSALTLVALSVAVVILASAVKKLSEINAMGLAKGVGAIGVILLELALFLKIANKTKFKMSTAVSLVIITGAIHIMVSAIKSIADIPVGHLVKGLATLGAILLELGLFSRLASGTKLISAALGITIVAGAIKLLVPSIQELGNTDVKTLAIGLTAMSVGLLAVVAALNLARGTMGGAVAITAASVALGLLAPVIITLGETDMKTLAIGLGAMAGGLTIVAVAAKLIGVGGALALMALAAAIAAIGVAAAGIGVAITAFVTAIGFMASMTMANVDSMIESLGGILTGLINLIPLVVDAILQLITGILISLADAVPEIAMAMVTIALGMIAAFVEFVPEFADLALEFLTAMMNTVAENADGVITSFVDMVLAVILGIANAIQTNNEDIVNAVVLTIEAILEVIIEAMVRIIEILFGWIPGVSEAARGMGDGAKEALREAFDVQEVGEQRADEFNAGISSRNSEARGRGRGLGQNTKDGAGSIDLTPEGIMLGDTMNSGVKSRGGNSRIVGKGIGEEAKRGAGSVDLNPVGTKHGDDFSSGIASRKHVANTSGVTIGNEADRGARSVDLEASGRFAGEGFAGGLESKSERVRGAAGGLAGLAKGAIEGILAIFSPSRVMIEDGQHTGEGFAIGMDNKRRRVAGSATDMAKGALNVVKSYASMFSDEMMDNLNLQPTITPVLDMNGMDAIDIGRDIQMTANMRMRDYIPETRTVDNRPDANGFQRETVLAIEELGHRIDRLASTPIQVRADIDGTLVSRKLAPQMRTEINKIDQTRTILLKGRREP